MCATLYGELEILQNDLTMKLVTSLTSSATENFDYIGISTVLVIPEGSSNGTVHCLDINIIDDDMLEGDETFNILWTTSEASVELINNITTIIIRDDEGEHTIQVKKAM